MDRALPRFFTLTILLSISAPLWAEEKPTSKPAAAVLFTADAYIEHVRHLASDELGGRGTGSEGGRKAAEYIAQQFKAAGCEPAGEDGSWYQPFEARQGKRLVDEKAKLEVSGLEREWKVREDWIPFPFTEMKDVEGPLAFAGYGIRAKAHEYDDYAGFDAEGKILLVLRHEPKSEDPEAAFGGEQPSRHAYFFRKARMAYKQNATALLIVNAPNRDPDQDQLYQFDVFNSQQTYDLPMVHITRAVADAILRQAGASDLKTLQEKLDKERKPLSQDLGLTVKLRPGVEPNTLSAKNVLGVVRGDGSTDEAIVVGAHYDHLGIRPPWRGDDRTPQIHNGADDNASGTAGVIELARAIACGPRLSRNVVFIAFDGEELGLLGSRHFVRNPTTDLENIRAMLNLDMIGRLKQDKFSLIGTSSAEEFPALADKTTEEVGLKYKSSSGFGGGSDHAAFVSRNIPAMFLFTGVHKEYHQPTDDWELIDAEGATKVLHMAHGIIVELANMEKGPTFVEPTGEPEEEPPIKPAVEEEKEAGEAGEPNDVADAEGDRALSRRNLRVRLGIIPDMVGDDQPGMLVDTVMDGGPAKEAGLQDGDRLMKIGDEDIRDIYGYMRAMRPFKPGDVVDVVIIREGEKKTLKVKLQAARPRRGKD